MLECLRDLIVPIPSATNTLRHSLITGFEKPTTAGRKGKIGLLQTDFDQSSDKKTSLYLEGIEDCLRCEAAKLDDQLFAVT